MKNLLSEQMHHFLLKEDAKSTYEFGNNENTKSRYCSSLATLLVASALRLLRTGEVGRNGVLRCLSLPLLSAEAGRMDGGVCGPCYPFPAVLQDSTRPGHVECSGCRYCKLVAVDSVDREK